MDANLLDFKADKLNFAFKTKKRYKYLRKIFILSLN